MDEPSAQINDVAIAYFYGFNFTHGLDLCKAAERLYSSAYCRAYFWIKEGSVHKKENDTVLDAISKFELQYYLPEYRALGRTCHIEINPNQLIFRRQTIPLRIVISLHESGVGIVLFLFQNINAIDLRDLKDLLFLDESPHEYSGSLVDSKLSGISSGPPRGLKLSELFAEVVTILQADGHLEARIVVPHTRSEGASTSRLDYRLYVGAFVSDPGRSFATPEEFVNKHRRDVFEIITSRSHYKDLDFYSSRSDAYIESILSRRLGNRRYAVYYLTEARMVAISLTKYHPDLYPYEFDWYVSYVSMLDIVRMQFQLLAKLNKTLYEHSIERSRLSLIGLRRLIARGLEEYHNLSLPVDIRTGEFIEHAKEAMNLKSLVGVVESRLELLTQSTTEYFDTVSQTKNEATTQAVNVLTLVLSISVAIEVVDKSFVNPPAYYYVLAWLGIAVSFYVVQRVLIRFAGRTYRRLAA